MMKPAKILVLIFSLLFFSCRGALAAPIKILFFYPGGQGSQELAQPLLDGFATALKKASDSKLEAKVFYIADLEKGLQFIAKEKPAAAIVSQDLADSLREKFKAETIARTLQLPSADGTDRFFIIGSKGAGPGLGTPVSGKLILPASRSIDPRFLREKAFPDLKFEIETKAVPNVLGLLRAIGTPLAKPDYGIVLLDEFEYANIRGLKAAWVEAIAPIVESAKIPSAPVLLFPGAGAIKEVLVQALEKMGQDPEAAEILENLRLKGFKRLSASPLN